MIGQIIKQTSILLFVFFYGSKILFSQNENKWDNSTDKNWKNEFELVSIPSSTDGKTQHAFFYKTSQKTPQPLIVSLHTWSGDYTQEDPLAKEIALRNWNYIHPDFRGPNNQPTACGSELVISDLNDAIVYAISNANVDTSGIHIIGVSGGGYTTLMAYMKLPNTIRSFNAWVPISNLSEWYWQSKGRKLKYADDLERIALVNGKIDWEILDQRSPEKLPFLPYLRKNSELNIYAGIHDGYSGSVPITHSIRFFNRIAKELFPNVDDVSISDSIILSLVEKRINPHTSNKVKLYDRIIHLQKELPGLKLTIFEGGHEMLVEPALTLPPIDSIKILLPLNILTIGDSNGATDYGWPLQLRKLLPYGTLINKSVSGNTIGFDNLNQPALNTIKNIDNYLIDALKEISGEENIDFILLAIGTNDAKKIYKDQQKEVFVNLNTLIKKIKTHFKTAHKKMPQICIISPPPMDETKYDKSKYEGGDNRVRKYLKEFKKVAIENGIGFLNAYDSLKTGFSHKTKDGIHLNEQAQFELAILIINYLNLNIEK
jgi:lysophospholipase L1-like esterase/pimeloyl-ACP methyl ester carboxylesterase